MESAGSSGVGFVGADRDDVIADVFVGIVIVGPAEDDFVVGSECLVDHFFSGEVVVSRNAQRVVFVVFLFLLFFLNPSIGKHGGVYFQKNYSALVGLVGGDELAPGLAFQLMRGQRIVYQDFFLFSVLWQRDKNKVLTLGLLGVVVPISSDE